MQPEKVSTVQTKSFKALLCQILPKLKRRKENIQRIRVSLKQYTPQDLIDIVILPQMSFIGYNFKDYNDAQPYSVEFGQGPDFEFAVEIAKKLKTYVAFGYMQKAKKNEKEVLYNSAAVVDRKGQIILNYRKTHLYFCDSLWSQQGQGFKTIEIQNTQGKKFNCTIAICMDINAKNFTSGEFELADFIVEKKSEILLFLTNWTDSEPKATDEQKSLMSIFNYWLFRLRPIVAAQNKRQLLFLAADRVGYQYSYFDKQDVHFFGGSCGIMLNPNYIIKNLGKKKEGYLMIDTKLPE